MFSSISFCLRSFDVLKAILLNVSVFFYYTIKYFPESDSNYDSNYVTANGGVDVHIITRYQKVFLIN